MYSMMMKVRTDLQSEKYSNSYYTFQYSRIIIKTKYFIYNFTLESAFKIKRNPWIFENNFSSKDIYGNSLLSSHSMAYFLRYV